ncbi:hypothetical protein [Actomonas aquatica]|uniref:DUF2802 domain-containing protein n=1 Tax=Actomonas aquatica TaxID=2866162 RepID=A0ABZ1CCX7_9BACT|nr:hypothetical protein [Opitutus sp. WL0086]WRQ89436.1 hypothetical protein K1X11_008440 [Opitutus sp. WL0086]
MDVIAFLIAFFAFLTAAHCKTQIKTLERQMAVLRARSPIADLDLLSEETKALIAQDRKSEALYAIKADVGCSLKEAEPIWDKAKAASST